MSSYNLNGTSKRRVLVAIGNAGRHLLQLQDAGLSVYDQKILVARPVVGGRHEYANLVVHYARDHARAWRTVASRTEPDDRVDIFGAAGGRTTSGIILRLAAELSHRVQLKVVIVTPFSWEDRRRQWRALYVRFRLRQMRRVDLAVIVTGRAEAEAAESESFDSVLGRLRDAAIARLSR